MSRVKSHRINVYHVKEEITINDIDLTSEGFFEEHSDNKIKIFTQIQNPSTPSWRNYLKKYISSDIEKIVNKTSSFVLLYNHNDNLYCLTGGYGHNKIKAYIRNNFGIDIALRMIDEKGISAINQRSMKGHTRQIYRAVRGYDPLFDKENYTRILNVIEGKGKFLGRKFRVTGKDSLTLRTEKDIEKLDEVFDEIENVALEEEKVHFPKSYSVVKDISLIESLNARAFDLISKFWAGQENRERLYLEFEDPFVQFRCDKFNVLFKRKSVDFSDFDLDVVRNSLVNEGILTIDELEDLGKMKLSGFNEDGFEEFSKESLWNLLVCEVTQNNKSYIKFKKQWLQILDEIKKFLDEQISNIPADLNILPEWNKNNFPEELDYNKHVAALKGWKCLDSDFIYIEGKSKIELCDLFNKSSRQFFHIKNTWGSKSAYLFTQGVTSAESYVNSSSFRKKCKEKWPDEFDVYHQPCEVVFGIASEKDITNNFPLNMTFFAKVNLYNAVTILKNLDYSVKLAPIRIVKG